MVQRGDYLGFPADPWPEVVARGTDKRFAQTYDIVSAYDGSLASVGRIVADSTWHHYFNVNLRGFLPGSAARNAIGDYYANLATWLSPSSKRAAMRCWFWWTLAVHPAVYMVKGNNFAVLGQTATDVLGRRASQCAITELVWPFPLPTKLREEFPWPPEELVIGGVLARYHEVFDRVSAGEKDLPDRHQLVQQGVRAAVGLHVTELHRMADAAGRLPDLIDERLTNLG